MQKTLAGKVAVVTGASRGIGKGIARALGGQGARVYVTGRTTEGARSIHAAARLVDEAGGEGRALQCDHGDDAQIAAAFETIGAEAGRVDVLVNNVYKIPDQPAWEGGFWQHPIQIWDDQVGIGLRAHYVAGWHAARWLFAAAQSGGGAAMVNVTSAGGESYHFSSSYGAGKAGLNRLTADMALELKPKGVAAIALCPGAVATEFIREAEATQGMDFSQMQTPLFVGRCLAALLGAGNLMARSGTVQWVEDLAEEFNVLDESGTRPPRYAQRVR